MHPNVQAKYDEAVTKWDAAKVELKALEASAMTAEQHLASFSPPDKIQVTERVEICLRSPLHAKEVLNELPDYILEDYWLDGYEGDVSLHGDLKASIKGLPSETQDNILAKYHKNLTGELDAG